MSKRLNGELITRYIKEHGIKYGFLAGKLEVSPSLLRQMEEGYYPCRDGDEIVSRLAKYLGVDVAALTPREDAKESA